MTYESAAKRKQDSRKRKLLSTLGRHFDYSNYSFFLRSKEIIRLSKPFLSFLKPHYESFYYEN